METDKHKKRKTGMWITLTITGDDRKMMEDLAKEVGLTKTEMIRRLICKMYIDEKLKDIIHKGYLTSHNVHYEQQKNGAAEPRNDAGLSSLNPTKNIQQNTETDNIESTLETYNKLFHEKLTRETFNQCPEAYYERINQELMKRWQAWRKNVNENMEWPYFKEHWKELHEQWEKNLQETIEIAKAPWVEPYE